VHARKYTCTLPYDFFKCKEVAGIGESRGEYRVLAGKPERKRPLGRPRRRWEDNIKIDLKEEGCGCMDWIELAKDRDRWRCFS